MLGNIRKWGPCLEHSLYFLYVTGFSKGAELKNGWLGICWNAAFKSKHLWLLHTRTTARQYQNLARDIEAFWNVCSVHLGTEMSSKRGHFCLLFYSHFRTERVKHTKGATEWFVDRGALAVPLSVGYLIKSCSAVHLQVYPISDQCSTPSAMFSQTSLTMQTELYQFWKWRFFF